MKTALVMLGYQLLWFIVVIGAARGWVALALLCAAAFIAAQIATSNRRLQVIRRLVVAVFIGMLADGVPAWLGWCAYASPSPAWPSGGAPLWLLSIWAAFATTLDAWEGWFGGRWLVAALLGAVGGPLAYAGAARGFHVITFPSGSTGLHVMVMWWAACWVVALPLLLAVGRQRAHASYGAKPTKDQRTDG